MSTNRAADPREQERICRELDNPSNLQFSLGSQAVIHRERGELDRALELLGEQERICREIDFPHAVQVALGNQAVIHRDRGELDQAMGLLQEQAQICRELGYQPGLALSLLNQGLVMRDRGDEAQAKLRQALDVANAAGLSPLVEEIQSALG